MLRITLVYECNPDKLMRSSRALTLTSSLQHTARFHSAQKTILDFLSVSEAPVRLQQTCVYVAQHNITWRRRQLPAILHCLNSLSYSNKLANVLRRRPLPNLYPSCGRSAAQATWHSSYTWQCHSSTWHSSTWHSSHTWHSSTWHSSHTWHSSTWHPSTWHSSCSWLSSTQAIHAPRLHMALRLQPTCSNELAGVHQEVMHSLV